MYPIRGMPSVVTDGEGIARIACKLHLRGFRLAAVGQDVVEDSSDVGVGVIVRQIDLNGNPLPAGVGVGRNAVAGNITGRIGIGYMPTEANSLPKRFSRPGASLRRNASFARSERKAAPTMLQIASFSGGR
jgi:hypothetical protein